MQFCLLTFLTTERIPQMISEQILNAGSIPFNVFINCKSLFLLVAGDFMEPTAILLILTPIFFPIAMSAWNRSYSS